MVSSRGECEPGSFSFRLGILGCQESLQQALCLEVDSEWPAPENRMGMDWGVFLRGSRIRLGWFCRCAGESFPKSEKPKGDGFCFLGVPVGMVFKGNSKGSSPLLRVPASSHLSLPCSVLPGRNEHPDG